MKNFLSVLVLIFVANTCLASAEGILEISRISVQSNGIGDSGLVSIEARKKSSAKYISFIVKAFGKEFMLSDSDLSKISEFSFNGIQLSYEAGYEILGGKTLYIILQRGFTTGVRKTVLITLTENGNITID